MQRAVLMAAIPQHLLQNGGINRQRIEDDISSLFADLKEVWAK